MGTLVGSDNSSTQVADGAPPAMSMSYSSVASCHTPASLTEMLLYELHLLVPSISVSANGSLLLAQKAQIAAR